MQAKPKRRRKSEDENSKQWQNHPAPVRGQLQVPAKAKVTPPGKMPRPKAHPTATPKSLSTAKPTGKRILEEPVEVAIPPPQNRSLGRAKRQASRRAQPSASTAHLRRTAGASPSREGRAQNVATSSESEASLPTTCKLKEISMNELSKIFIKQYPCAISDAHSVDAEDTGGV